MPDETNKISILVVDDSDIILHALKNFFEDYYFEVVTCHDGIEGIQKAVEFKPKIIFLDLMMPNLDGVKMLQVMKVMNDLKDIPVVVISGNTNKRNVIASIEAGAEKVLSKPLKKELIKKSISEILGPEFLSKAKKQPKVESNFEYDLTMELRKYFLNGFSDKKKLMETSLEKKDLKTLRYVFHEFKGTGGSIGSQELTHIGMEVEERIDDENIDWEFFRKQYESVLKIIDEFKNELAEK